MCCVSFIKMNLYLYHLVCHMFAIDVVMFFLILPFSVAFIETIYIIHYTIYMLCYEQSIVLMIN